MARVVIAATKAWNKRAFEHWARRRSHQATLIETAEELTSNGLAELAPDHVFFPHWSWKIPAEIHERYECIIFHMTDVPFGRGGSPLQNLILRGVRETQITALRAVAAMDAGPVYLKRPLCLAGSAEEIFVRAAGVVFEMIDEILDQRPTPVPQSGEVVEFKRRKPAESAIPECRNLDQLFDFLRMLDADGYPRAFLVHQGYRYELSRAARKSDRIVADVTITAVGQVDRDEEPPR